MDKTYNDIFFDDCYEILDKIQLDILKIKDKYNKPRDLEKYLREFRVDYPKKENLSEVEFQKERLVFAKFIITKESTNYHNMNNEINLYLKELINKDIYDKKYILVKQQKTGEDYLVDFKKKNPFVQIIEKLINPKYQNNIRILNLTTEKLSQLYKTESSILKKLIIDEPDDKLIYSVDFDLLNNELNLYNKYESLDSLINEHPLFLNQPLYYMSIKPLSELIDNQIKIYENKIKEIRQDLKIPIYKQVNVVIDLSYNELLGCALKALNLLTWKMLEVIKTYKEPSTLIVSAISICVIHHLANPEIVNKIKNDPVGNIAVKTYNIIHNDDISIAFDFIHNKSESLNQEIIKKYGDEFIKNIQSVKENKITKKD